MQYGKFTAPCYGFRVDRYRGIVYLKKKQEMENGFTPRTLKKPSSLNLPNI